MPQAVSMIIAIASLMAGLAAGFCAEGLMLAGSPNSSPEQLRVIKFIMLAVAAMNFVGFVTGIVLIVKHHEWWAAIVGGAPVVIIVVLFIIALVGGW